MSKKRVHELAKELGIENKELIARLEKIGIAVKSHSSTLEEGDVERILKELKSSEPREVVEQRIKTGVIRRRSVRLPAEEAEPAPAAEAPVEAAKPAAEALPREPEKPSEAPPVVPPAEAVRTKGAAPKKEPVSKAVPPAPPEPPAPEPPAAEAETRKVGAPAPTEAAVVPEPTPKEKDVTPKPAPAAREAETASAAGAAPPAKEKAVPAPPARAAEKEVRKPVPSRPDLMITRDVVPPRPEAPSARTEADKSKKRGKKPVEVLMEESAPAKKKVFVKKQFVDRKARQIEVDTEERTPRWREEKRPAVVRMKKTEITVPKASKRRIKVGDAISVGDLAKKMGVKASEVINKLMGLGMMATINQPIDFEAASLIATEFGYQAELMGQEFDETLLKAETPAENLRPRAPVVTIMGHVDHGKTSLLDAIRETNIIDEEAGGITQAIGAYHVHIKNRDIVFLDTPGHEAFTAMRARGAQVTDIVVLVVAADDGVMDQTVEAINHSRDAGVPIVVAINKIDKPGADSGRIKQALTEYNLVPEEWGGETIFSEVSAKQKIGIEELLELILLQADILELKADPDRPARGVIIEAKLDRGRGPVATVLIQEGTLREGDAFVSRTEYGRVRAMIDDKGQRMREAGPSTPVEVIGFSRVPQASSEFIGVEDEKKARSIGEYWIRKERERELSATAKITLEQLYAKIKEGVKELNVILKADVQGSVEALVDALGKLGAADIKIKIIHSSTGAITETDVMLASASNAVIIGFNVRPDARVAEVAETEGVEIKLYDIIYNVIADMKAAMEGLLEPEYREVSQGRAEVRDIFKVPKIGTIAGCYVTDGKLARSSGVKLVREGVVLYDGRIASLRRFKDDVKEVATGFECGIGIENYNDIRIGDVIEAYVQEEIERKL